MAEIEDTTELPDYLNQSAHLLGNYHKYYTFHSVQSRNDLLQNKSLFLELWNANGKPDQFNYLDIGCNEGDLSLAVADLIKSELPEHVKCVVIGVDLDHSLIQLANNKFSERNGSGMISTSPTFFGVDFMKDDEINIFRQSLASLHQISHFHLVSIFSTTMWVHINGGDVGLLAFLQSAKSFLADDGVLLIEPQPTKCYRSAGKRCRKLGLPIPPFLNQVDKANVNHTLTKMMKDTVALRHESYLGTEDWGRPMRLFYNCSYFQQTIGEKHQPPPEQPLVVHTSSQPKKKKQKCQTEGVSKNSDELIHSM
jgi:SAM-dependent methyltransferase